MNSFIMSKMNDNRKEAILEVTQEDYDTAMAKGWNDDDIQKPGKYRYRRATRFAKPEDLHPSNITVHINLSVSLEVLQHFERSAEKSSAESAQAAMAAELLAAMERDKQAELTAVERLLANPEFIRAVGEKLREQQAAEKDLQTPETKTSAVEVELQAA